MARISSKVASGLVKAIGIKRRLQEAAEFDDDPAKLAEIVAKLRRTDQLEPSRRLQRYWKWEPFGIAGNALHVMENRTGRSPRVILYLHGGGYMFGPFGTEWAACHRVSAATDCDFALLVYPKAPEHQAPETLAAAAHTFTMLEKRYGAENVIVMGASAGGGLAIALMAQLRDARRSLPAMGVLISPGVDMTLVEPIGKLESGDVLLSTDHVRSVGRLYAGPLGPGHPWVSPLFGDLGGLPLLHLFVGTEEILLPSVMTFADEARAAGTDVSLFIGEGQQHTWPLAPTPDGRDALLQIAHIIEFP